MIWSLMLLVSVCVVGVKSEDAELLGNATLPLEFANSQGICREHFDFSTQPKDCDSMPICPTVNPGTNPSLFLGCAFKQAKSWHPPTQAEKTHLYQLLSGLKNKDIPSALAAADELGLQACRNKDDNYVVFTTKPQIHSYVGPFFLYRERGASPLVIQNGHDEDCTPIGYGKQVFLNTNALFSMSNGYPRAISGTKIKTCWGSDYESDGCHDSNNLFYLAHTYIYRLWPQTVFIHNHGMKGPGMLITNSLRTDSGKDSLLYAFTSGLLKTVQARGWTPDKIAKLRVCSPGTQLPNIGCQLVSTWIEGRYSDGSKAPTCKNGHNNTNRWLGMEQSGGQILPHPEILSTVLKGIENGYLEGERVN